MKRSVLTRICLSILIATVISTAIFESLPPLKYDVHDPKYRWIKKQIFEEKGPVDTVFLGSSHIWNAVDTNLLNRTMRERLSLNFGVNWQGTDTKFVIARDLVRRRKVQNLVLEIASSDDGEHHEYFPFLARLPDALAASWDEAKGLGKWSTWRRRHEVQDRVDRLVSMWLPFAVKGFYFGYQEWLGTPPEASKEPYGFLPETNIHVFPDPAVRFEQPVDTGEESELTPWIHRLASLCREEGVNLYFLFVPSRNESLPSPMFLRALRRVGQPLVLDPRVYYQAGLWFNASHLNQSGATAFTNLLLRSSLYKSALVYGIAAPRR